MKPHDPRAIVPNTSARDAIVAVSLGVLVLAFVLYGIFTMRSPGSGNTLTGTVLGKRFVPQKEQLISVGKKGLSSRETDGEYLLEVHVAEEKRTFDVPVEKPAYESASVGQTMKFMRPPSEQR